ncbi:MAG: 3-phosphoglycerate dehydrogenase family protein [Candidatus Nanoarchaeia archaeon]
MKKVLIPTKLEKVAAETLKTKGYTVVQDGTTPLAELAKLHPDTEVIIVRSEKVTPEIIDAFPKLKLIVRAGAGYDTIDIKYARKKNIDVMNTPGANANAVAEEVVAMMLAVCRHLVPADISTRKGEWEKNKFMGTELTGKTVGILGMGNIGKLVAKRIQGFEVKILAYDPILSADLAESLGVELSTVENIFQKSDFITLHIPQTPETKGMVNKRLLSLMKPGAVLINCARAGIINEEDLRQIKKEKKIFFCNDVYPKDEPGPKSVADIADIMLPHLGASTVEANTTAAIRAAEQTIAYFEKGVTNFVVNKGVPDGLDGRYQELAFVLSKIARSYLGKGTAPHQIETSFYGNLGKFAKWLIAPIVAGISSEFDIYLDAADAEAFLKGRGIVYNNRDVDETKKYGESMTIDLYEGTGTTIRKVSVRGTIAENNLMLSRINDFDKMYLDPHGYTLFVEYADKPGVLGKIASLLGGKNINITDVRAPQSTDGKKAIAVIKTATEVPEQLVAEIASSVNADNAFTFCY